MKNNHGEGKFETIIIILLVLLVFTFLFKSMLDSMGNKDFIAMRQNALAFGKAVSVNAESFQNLSKVSLGEAIEEKALRELKNPLGRGYCDETESKVVLDNDKYLVTLRCGKYLIENESLNTIEDAQIYKVSEWQSKKFANADKKTLYNCEKDGKEIYPEYYDETYFLYKVNSDNETDYYSVESVDTTCKVLKKQVYREKEKINE